MIKKLLDLKGLKEVVKFEIFELILEYFEFDNIIFLRHTLFQINIINIEKNLLLNSKHKKDLLVCNWINEKEKSIDTLCQHFPPIEFCFNQPCIVDPDIMLDLLFNTLKNSIIREGKVNNKFF